MCAFPYFSSGRKFKSFLIKFPSFTASSLFSAVKLFIISICTVTVGLDSFYAKPFGKVILRHCCSATLMHSTRYFFWRDNANKAEGCGFSRILLCSVGKPSAMLANIKIFIADFLLEPNSFLFFF